MVLEVILMVLGMVLVVLGMVLVALGGSRLSRVGECNRKRPHNDLMRTL